jgi:HSP20 family molecular chaperone IbpA
MTFIFSAINNINKFAGTQMLGQLKKNATSQCSGPCFKMDFWKNFTYKMDVANYRPEELNVKIEGNEIVIHGTRKENICRHWGSSGDSLHILSKHN